MKAFLLIEGNVQGVSFRVLSKQLAKNFGLKGLVKNLENNSVQIFLDGSKEKIEEFIAIVSKIKSEKAKPFSLHVEKIACFFEGENGFQKAWKKYAGFEIDYGTKFNAFEKENLEKLEIGSLVLHDFSMQTGKNFEKLDSKYGVISKKMGKVEQELKEERTLLRKELIEFKKSLNVIANGINEGNEKIVSGIEKIVKTITS